MKNIFIGSFHIYKYWHNKNNEFNNLESINTHVLRSVEEGRIVVTCQGKTFTVNKGEMLYIPLGRYADIKIFAEPNCHGTVLRFVYLPIVEELGYPPQAIKMSDELKRNFDNIPIMNLYEENLNSHIIWKIYRFLYIFQKAVTKYADKHSLKIQKALTFMKENDNYTISELAEYCKMNERRFRTAFKNILDVSPIQMKQRIQAVKADALLKTTDLSVEEIANKVGLSSPNQLRAIMKKRYFSLPKDVRKKFKYQK